jgi:hypothetical protein
MGEHSSRISAYHSNRAEHKQKNRSQQDGILQDGLPRLLARRQVRAPLPHMAREERGGA